MKKYWVLVLGVALLAFVWITYSKQTGTDRDDRKTLGIESEERGRITSFWQDYHEATRLRVDGLFSDAIDKYREALVSDPDHEESLYYLGNCLFELGDYTAALEAYRRLVNLNPGSQRGHSQIATVLSSVLPGSPLDLEAASEAFRKTIEINREQSGPFLRLGKVAFQQGDLKEALAHFETAAGFRSPEGYYLAGLTLFHRGQYTKALDWFAELFQLHQKEQAISGRGLVSEGDLETSGSNSSLSPLDAAVHKSILVASWAAEKLGGYEGRVPGEYRYNSREDVKSQMKGPVLFGRGRGAWGDFDGDGDQDLVTLSADQAPALFQNQKGRLTKVSEETGLELNPSDWDACWGDYDGDGDQDLYVIRSGFIGRGQNSLYQNLGGWELGLGSFRDVTEEAGLLGVRSTWRTIFIDFDLDGRLDLVEVGRASADFPSARIFRNLSGERFSEESRKLGIDFLGHGIDIAVGDYDGDGDKDLYLMRWHRSGILYRNERQSFSDQTEAANLSNVDGNGFSSLFFDYNRDGLQDLLVSTYAPYEFVVTSLLHDEFRASGHTPRLFRNLDGVGFAEVSQDVAFTRAFGTVRAEAADLDQDGWIDLVFSNGGIDPLRMDDSTVLWNDRGKRFSEMSRLAEEPGVPSPSWGVAISSGRGAQSAVIQLGGTRKPGRFQEPR